MEIRRRFWLIVPVWALFAADVALTLIGQSSEYWAGHYAHAVEFNPIAFLLLTCSPWLFVGLAVVWGILLGGFIVCWRHPFAERLAFLIGFGHAIGGSSWLVGSGPWGWPTAVVYLMAASQFAKFCWRRTGRQEITSVPE